MKEKEQKEKEKKEKKAKKAKKAKKEKRPAGAVAAAAGAGGPVRICGPRGLVYEEAPDVGVMTAADVETFREKHEIALGSRVSAHVTGVDGR